MKGFFCAKKQGELQILWSLDNMYDFDKDSVTLILCEN